MHAELQTALHVLDPARSEWELRDFSGVYVWSRRVSDLTFMIPC